MWPITKDRTRRARVLRGRPPEASRVVASVSLGGRAVPLKMRKSPRARRLSLRLDPTEDAVELVLPRGVTLSEGLRFAEEKSGWILTRLALRPPRVPFAPGSDPQPPSFPSAANSTRNPGIAVRGGSEDRRTSASNRTGW